MGYGAILGQSFDGFTKEQTLSQTTAQALGLTQSDPTPDDAFAKLGIDVESLNEDISNYTPYETIIDTTVASRGNSTSINVRNLQWDKYFKLILLLTYPADEFDASNWYNVIFNLGTYTKNQRYLRLNGDLRSGEGVGCIMGNIGHVEFFVEGDKRRRVCVVYYGATSQTSAMMGYGWDVSGLTWDDVTSIYITNHNQTGTNQVIEGLQIKLLGVRM